MEILQKMKKIEQNFSPHPIFHGDFERKKKIIIYVEKKPPLLREKNKKAIAKTLLLCPACSLVQRCPHPARPLGVCGPFFVRSALKKCAH